MRYTPAPPEVPERFWVEIRGGLVTGRLEDKVAIITGGATGMGRAASLLFADEGAKVTVADRNLPEGQATAAMVGEAGGEALFVETDVSKSDQVSNMVARTLERFGKLDVLVNNAGILIRTPPLAEVSELVWDLTLDTNVRGVFLCTKYAIPHMVGRGGSIINVSSGAGIHPTTHAVPYGVSKAGVIQLTLTTSSQYAPEGVRCNVIVPGPIDTPQARGSTGSAEEFALIPSRVALGRAGTPRDIANLMMFLASDESSFISGAAIQIHGGGQV
ncbi:MAG: glucose 1-dehydrogenase [bacterium]|nr:glucose 1-dehydrogenase [bacterium]MDE0674342.1 glucose 1-dehydrogenase [bacterium]